MTSVILNKPPITRLSLQHLWLPIAALIIAVVFAINLTLQHGISSISYLQLAIGIGAIGSGFGWLVFSWSPGAASQKDIAVPWLAVGMLLAAGYAVDDGSFTFTQSLVKTIALYALPFMASLTLLTRLYAPTDLCSSSSAMGFCSGGCVLIFMAFAPDITLASALYTCAAVLGIVMGASRIVLCHLIKW